MELDRLDFLKIMKNPLMKEISFKGNKKQKILLLGSFVLVTDDNCTNKNTQIWSVST